MPTSRCVLGDDIGAHWAITNMAPTPPHATLPEF
jgi:hypothetical protein